MRLRETDQILFKIVLVLGVFSCNGQTQIENMEVEVINDIDNISHQESLDIKLIIPQSGCTGCLHVLKERLNNNKTDFEIVFTRIINKRDLNLIYGKALTENSKTKIDFENRYFKVIEKCINSPVLIFESRSSNKRKILCLEIDTMDQIFNELENKSAKK